MLNMTVNKCFKHNCELEIKYICKCSDLETYSCDLHFGRHLKLADRTHHFESISSQPDEEIKDNLEKEKSKKEKIKKNALASKSKDQHKKQSKRRKIESDSEEAISDSLKQTINLIKEEPRVLDLQLDAIKKNSSDPTLINETALKSKDLNEEIGLNIKKKTLLDFQLSSDSCKKWDNKKQLNKTPLNSLTPEELTDKISKLWNEGNNPEAEKDFRRISSFYKSGKSISDPELKDAYQEYINAYHKATSVSYFLLTYDTTLFIYDTENESFDLKVLETPEHLNHKTCTALLPNGDLFCYGSELLTGITLIIDRNFNIRRLPNGVGCQYSSAIYFNRNVYCFGGDNRSRGSTLSTRFDLDKNQWFQLANLSRADFDCHNEIFNENIVICGDLNRNLLVYSVNIDSFSLVPNDFSNGSKILMKTDRLYLIEFKDSYIHESGIGDEYTWKIIGSSKFNHIDFKPYHTYNKGVIHLVGGKGYWKFDLNKKTITKNGFW